MANRTLKLTPRDIDALARIIKAEAGNQSDVGQMGVLFTILNRAAADGHFPNDVVSVIEQPNQFEPLANKSSVFDLPEASDLAPKISGWLNDYQAGALADPTNGATFFQNVAITNQRGTNFARSEPVSKIGDHSFYDRYGDNARVEVPAYSVAFDGSAPIGPAPSSPASFSNEGAPPFSDLAAQFNPQPISNTALGLFAAADTLAGRESGLSALEYLLSQPSPTPLTGVGPGAGMTAYAPGTFDTSAREEHYGHEHATALASSPATGGTFGLRPVHDGVDLSGLNPDVMSAAQQAASLLGYDIPVTSAFRSQSKQDKIRAGRDTPLVAKNSQHTHGTALDIPIKNMSEEQVAQLVDALAASGFTAFGHYGKDGHLHADMRGSVPKSFNPDTGWGGWTALPPAVMEVLVRRGWTRGAPSSSLLRGLLS